ncbi:MAG: imidazoleglycerol-phosphate dehydratase [Thermoplasmatales archaeon]|nr:imidazoleglycerol-phosphate dehydratase [Thermoplasmatales archaeon]
MAPRKAELERQTRETRISVSVVLDGKGEYDVKCDDVPFLRHMVETLSRYSGVDIRMSAGGDNDHHIVEDAAISLGKAIAKAIDGPIARFSTKTVAMDDALVMASIDIIDRPYAEVDCPDQLYAHFLRSFAMSLGMTLHVVQIRGEDAHHVVEASFKALGMCLREALAPVGDEISTKDKPRYKG